MLITLQIENYALFEQAAIPFAPGFNVLTGETGSGKSILVDALGLLLGERAETGAIRSGAGQAAVSGVFARPFASAAAAAAWSGERGLGGLEEEVHLRREIGAARSRAFVDHQPVTLALLRELARRLGDIHAQNEALVSFTAAAQLRLLDRFAGVETGALGRLWAEWREAREQLQDEERERRLQTEQAELWRFQAEEIAAVAPHAGEDGRLAAERQVLANAGRVLGAAQAAYGALYDDPEAATVKLKAALRQIQEWQRFDPAAAALGARLEAARAEVDDIAREAQRMAERIEASPQRLAEVEERLAALDRLRRKYGPGIEEVVQRGEELRERLQRLAQSDTTLAAARERAEASEKAYRRAAEELSRKRRAAGPKLSRALEAAVSDLAMTLQFEVEFATAEAGTGGWTAAGWDGVRFLASTNPGEPLQPVAAIASGGELSRLLLALHLVAEEGEARLRRAGPGTRGRAEAPTLVLDEIDAGIGGQAAVAVGRKLQQLGEHYQVLCVTHLAQIACHADHHLRVEKRASEGRTITEITPLEGKGREGEIARMLAGNGEDPTALRHARELLRGSTARARRQPA